MSRLCENTALVFITFDQTKAMQSLRAGEVKVFMPGVGGEADLKQIETGRTILHDGDRAKGDDAVEPSHDTTSKRTPDVPPGACLEHCRTHSRQAIEAPTQQSVFQASPNELPWQMTRGEFHESRDSQGFTDPQENSRLYWEEIEKAPAKGKELPPRVLYEYEKFREFYSREVKKPAATSEELRKYEEYVASTKKIANVNPRPVRAWIEYYRAHNRRNGRPD
ncbi:MAG: hypothetical protein ABIP48_01325 [Planctomycetota bacterium]